jgi:hypothetical protein
MWGGDIECEFAWVWEGEREETVFYRAVLAADEQGREANQFLTDTTGAFAISRNRRRFIVNGDVLTLVLIHHGLLLRDGCFELMRRRLPWECYRLPEATTPSD